MSRPASLPALCCRRLPENQISVAIQYACPKVVSVPTRLHIPRYFATPLNAAYLRTWGKAPDGIAMWYILLALILSSFTHRQVGPQSMNIVTTDSE
eukprot:1079445-Pyramimonas_sp.AAC.1